MYYCANAEQSLSRSGQEGARQSPFLIPGCLPLLAVLLLVTPVCQAGQTGQQHRAVSIPDAAGPQAGRQTSLLTTESGTVLQTGSGRNEAWLVLKEALSRLGIPLYQVDAGELQLTTDWVSWYYDTKSRRGRSRLPRFSLSREPERHRFRFSISEMEPQQAVIEIRDVAAEREIDIAPDSSYAWLQWKAVSTDPAAASSFLSRLQVDIESAMMSSYVPAAVTKTDAPPEHGHVAGTGVAQPTAVADAVTTGSGSVLSVDAEQLATAPARVRKEASGPEAASGSVSAKGGLLIKATPARAWQALLLALHDLDIGIEKADEQQYLITTKWLEADYEKKNHKLLLGSNGQRSWAFDRAGEGLQRHRFQLMLVPAEAGQAAMVYAYHIGYQEQIDRTPDSSRTLFAWQDRKTDPAAAAAFLRQLRIHASR